MGQYEEGPIPSWGLAVAGATGAVIANAIVYPLDIVKTRLQVQINQKHHADRTTSDSSEHYNSTWDAIHKIIEQEGSKGLYSGINGALIGVASTNFAYFYWYSVVRSLYTSQRSPGHHGTVTELTLGAVAGAIAQVFTIPIAVITTRQQTQARGEDRSIVATAKDVINSEDGWTGLWRGLKASLVLVVNPAITYAAYKRLQQTLFPKRVNLRPSEAFLLGAMSKSLATIVTQPLIVAKVGLQSKPPPPRVKPFKSFIEVIEFIVENEGYFGLFKGIGPQILKGLIVQGLLMMTKERMEILFILLFRYIRTLKSKQLQRSSAIIVKKALPLVK